MKPEITIIVPVYNAESFLGKCINSILSQSYTNFELFLINDGSSDNSGEICNKYAIKDNRIKVFHKNNGGVSSSRNLGIDNAQGKWMMFIDSDDEITPNCLELCISKSKKGSVDLIEFGCYHLIENKLKIAFKYNESETTISKKKFWDNCYKNFAVWGHLFRTDHILNYNIRFEENLIMSEDRIFFYKYLYYTKEVGTISNCTYLYRQHKLSVCNTPISINKIESQYQAIKILTKEYDAQDKNYLTNKIFTFLAESILKNYLISSIEYKNKDIYAKLKHIKQEIFKTKINIPFLNLLSQSVYIYKLYYIYIVFKTKIKSYIK